MPLYLFYCDKCEISQENKTLTTAEKWEWVAKKPEVPNCGVCVTPMERDWGAEQGGHIPASGFPFVTKNIHPDGKPIEVRSAAHMAQLCKEFGVEHRPDSAWLEKEFLGYDPKTRKPMYKESSGVGMPNCWF